MNKNTGSVERSSLSPAWLRRNPWLVASLSFVFLQALPSLRLPLDRDHGVFLTMGRCILDGGIPYANCWDTKPPGVFYLFSLIVGLFGASAWGVRLFDFAWLLAFSYLLFRFSERYLGRRVSALGVALYSVAYLNLGYRNTASAESFMMLFVLAGFLLVVSKRGNPIFRSSLAGVSIGLAFWFKFSALVFLPLALLLPFLRKGSRTESSQDAESQYLERGGWSKVCSLIAGFVLIVALVPLYFQLAGALPAFQETFFEVVPRYVRMGFELPPDYISHSLIQLQERLGIWTEIMFALALGFAWKASDRQRLLPLLLAAMLGIASILLQARQWGYTFAACLPFLSLLWAYVAVKIFRWGGWLAAKFRGRGMRLAPFFLWVLLASICASFVVPWGMKLADRYRASWTWIRNPEAAHRDYAWSIYYGHWSEMMRVIDYVEENSRPGERIYVWGFEPFIYFKSERGSPTRFITNMPQIAPWCPPAWREELMRDLRADPPTLLVVNRDDAVYPILHTRLDSEQSLEEFPALTQFLTEHYVSARDFHAFHVFRLRR